jgi:hypothetical protein
VSVKVPPKDDEDTLGEFTYDGRQFLVGQLVFGKVSARWEILCADVDREVLLSSFRWWQTV